MPLLDECPYAVQAVFWLVVMGGAGWGIGIAVEATKQKKPASKRPREVEAHR